MIKRQHITIILCLFLITNLATAQDKSQKAYDLFEDTPAEVEDQVFRVDFFIPGFQYEKRLNAESTIQAAVYLNFGIFYGDFPNELNYDSGILPTIEVSYRYYYNLYKRKGKFKNFTNNSGQYIAPKLSLTSLLSPTTIFNNYNRSYLGGVWGFQKNGDPITFNFEIGLGYRSESIDYKSQFIPDVSGANLTVIGKLRVGFLVGKRNRAYKKFKQDTYQ